MNIKDIAKTIDGKIVCGDGNNQFEVEKAFASDLMSDVLTINTDNLLLITGLANVQAIRTAEMADIRAIVIARKKKATVEMKELASENKMFIIECNYSVYKTAGLLYQAGLNPLY